MEADSGGPAAEETAAAVHADADPATGEWRAEILPEARQRIVNKIMETLEKHLPINVSEGLDEVHIIAEKFEERIYTTATSQSDYIRKIALKMLSLESTVQQPAPINPTLTNISVEDRNPVDTGHNQDAPSLGGIGNEDRDAHHHGHDHRLLPAVRLHRVCRVRVRLSRQVPLRLRVLQHLLATRRRRRRHYCHLPRRLPVQGMPARLRPNVPGPV